METAKLVVALAFVLLSSIVLRTRGALYVQSTSTTVSEGTQTTFNCFNDGQADDANIFTTGGKVEWCRTTQYSATLERVAEWTRDAGATILLSGSEDRISIIGGLSTHTMINQNLVIRNTSKTDQGSYICLLYRGDGTKEDESMPLALTVKYAPAEYYPLCTATPDGLGNEITLNCKSEITTPAVTIQWYKNNVMVADGMQVGLLNMESTYVARTDELDSQFECRLHYRDKPDISISRSCRFSKPYVAIARTSELGLDNSLYRAFANANPPFVSDIECIFEASATTTFRFDTEFPGYGVATVGPLSSADNGSHLICRAKNVFGWGQTRMAIYSYGDGTRGEATSPSVVTNYMPDANTSDLSVVISPIDPVVTRGGNATFSCSYSLTVHTPTQAKVAISWRYNDVDVTKSTSKLTVTESSLQVIGVSDDDDGARVTCIATMVVGETEVVNIPPGESSTRIYVSSEQQLGVECGIGGACQQESVQAAGESSIFRNPAFAIGISIFAVIACIVIVVLILMIAAQRKKRSRSRLGSEDVTSQMTFRAGNGSVANGRATRGDQMPQHTANTVRALPAQPPTDHAPVGPAGKPMSNRHVVMPTEAPRPEMTYQEMVGHTGVNKARNGNPAPTTNGAAMGAGGIGPASTDSVRGPPVMVPAPNGGFVPHTMASSSRLNEKKSAQDGGDTNYEDLDRMRQNRASRAPGNDYQTSISNTPCQPEELQPMVHYANS